MDYEMRAQVRRGRSCGRVWGGSYGGDHSRGSCRCVDQPCPCPYPGEEGLDPHGQLQLDLHWFASLVPFLCHIVIVNTCVILSNTYVASSKHFIELCHFVEHRFCSLCCYVVCACGICSAHAFFGLQIVFFLDLHMRVCGCGLAYLLEMVLLVLPAKKKSNTSTLSRLNLNISQRSKNHPQYLPEKQILSREILRELVNSVP
jgi:hypothetical protein